MSNENNLVANLGGAQPIPQGEYSNLDLSSAYPNYRNPDMVLNNTTLDEQVAKINNAYQNNVNVVQNTAGSNFATGQNIVQNSQVQVNHAQHTQNMQSTQGIQYNIAQLKHENNIPTRNIYNTSYLQQGNSQQKTPKPKSSKFGIGFFLGIFFTLILLVCGSIFFKETLVNLVNEEFYVTETLGPIFSQISKNLGFTSGDNLVFETQNVDENIQEEGINIDASQEDEHIQESEITLTKVSSIDEANWVKTENCNDLSCGDYTQVDNSQIVLCQTFKQVETLADDKPRIGNSGGCRYKDDSELYYLNINI